VFDSTASWPTDGGASVRLAQALERQAVALDRAARVVAAARERLPAAAASGFWRGEARSRYADAVDEAARHLQSAEGLLDTAASQSRRAIASLAARAG
jgi:uncharacterized protein YukE